MPAFFLRNRPPPRSTLFPSPTLFRSRRAHGGLVREPPREGGGGRGLRADPGDLRPRRVRGVDAPRPEGVAPREAPHPRGRDPAAEREDRAVHGGEKGRGWG